MIVVSDTSPIGNLLQIGQLDLLKTIFTTVFVPPTVHKEVLELQKFGISTIRYQSADWIVVQQLASTKGIAPLLELLDAGESEALLLAMEIKADWILMDERAGTRKAEEMGLRPIGLIGILMKAKEQGLITNVTSMIEMMRVKAGFWISDHFLEKIRIQLNE
ncbi:MAG TPA: DUF3368 domain-containing protein [Saprospiraceae bacterium]|nr:DUF3368 domain-containing protein [Saprospiraceae bacterium]HMP24290.1 DUF3368 domain-containing protein [Saprospiraceae bacterium]